jgi:hypothetical protein
MFTHKYGAPQLIYIYKEFCQQVWVARNGTIYPNESKFHR